MNERELSEEEYETWLKFIEIHQPKFNANAKLILILVATFCKNITLTEEICKLLKQNKYEEVIEQLIGKGDAKYKIF